jgi:hypothetical protein
MEMKSMMVDIMSMYHQIHSSKLMDGVEGIHTVT